MLTGQNKVQVYF